MSTDPNSTAPRPLTAPASLPPEVIQLLEQLKILLAVADRSLALQLSLGACYRLLRLLCGHGQFMEQIAKLDNELHPNDLKETSSLNPGAKIRNARPWPAWPAPRIADSPIRIDVEGQTPSAPQNSRQGKVQDGNSMRSLRLAATLLKKFAQWHSPAAWSHRNFLGSTRWLRCIGFKPQMVEKILQDHQIATAVDLDRLLEAELEKHLLRTHCWHAQFIRISDKIHKCPLEAKQLIALKLEEFFAQLPLPPKKTP